ncbi:hypothetical protein [Flavobacterium sp. PL002]|uniref:hypothetical protein n=1 Tax=Flavobacterium sp. PL002 TaxID=1897058 RepID=UPI0017878154|nr:hypothetical protein [Flavobacterium sp. PL002]
MFEIILLGIAGLITIGLSIKNIIENSDKELKLKKVQTDLISKQDMLINLQNTHSNELKNKSDEIIRLQNLLQEKNNTQLELMDRMNSPIPEFIDLVFNSTLEIPDKEFEKLKKTFVSNPNLSNLLPFDSKLINQEFENIDSFKNIYFSLDVTFDKNGKKMNINFKRGPLSLYGYNTAYTINSFILSYSSEESKIKFNTISLKSNEITTNYKSPSLEDFINSKVTIRYHFGFPYKMHVGNVPSSPFYISNRENNLRLNFNSINLNHKNYNINIKNLKKIDSKSFEGIWHDVNK